MNIRGSRKSHDENDASCSASDDISDEDRTTAATHNPTSAKHSSSDSKDPKKNRTPRSHGGYCELCSGPSRKRQRRQSKKKLKVHIMMIYNHTTRKSMVFYMIYVHCTCGSRWRNHLMTATQMKTTSILARYPFRSLSSQSTRLFRLPCYGYCLESQLECHMAICLHGCLIYC